MIGDAIYPDVARKLARRHARIAAAAREIVRNDATHADPHRTAWARFVIRHDNARKGHVCRNA
ncbi:MAG: hypothetical protein ACO3GP_03245 [Candidatus Limnocylindrus sp.]